MPSSSHAPRRDQKGGSLPTIETQTTARSRSTISSNDGTEAQRLDTRASRRSTRSSARKPAWWKVRLFRGMVDDVRRRAPYYASDWTDAWDYRVIPATIYMYFAKLAYPNQTRRIMAHKVAKLTSSTASSLPLPSPSTCSKKPVLHTP